MSQDPIIALRGVKKRFGALEVLRGIDLTVDQGVSSVVMGGSGSGKSVLIKHIVGLLKPDAGQVWVKGKRVDTLEGDAL
ncbi:MAG: ATP-binding cassette domain-containing protein, partial [Bacteroidetes bacterium]|nr:ATP-binding cassette domain-containing protein [Bacteroidota bacterium]